MSVDATFARPVRDEPGAAVSDVVLTSVEGGVGTLSFNRPEKHNALDDAMLAQWRAVLAALAADDAVQVIVLRGEGSSFSSGRDTTQLGRRPPGVDDFGFVLREQREALRVRHVQKPVVAALKGWTLGGALELALHADIRLAAVDARMGLPEVRYGIVPDVGGLAVLHALVGPERTKRLAMSGEPIDADTALAWGIVSEVVAAEHLDERVGALAAALAAQPTGAVQDVKALVDALTDDQLDHELARELRAQVRRFGERPTKPA
jgi:enoyl-CoA hydratase/carnithine racemase